MRAPDGPYIVLLDMEIKHDEQMNYESFVKQTLNVLCDHCRKHLQAAAEDLEICGFCLLQEVTSKPLNCRMRIA